MAFLKFWYKTSLVVLCLATFDTQICSAQLFTKDPTKWWPDPSTGLMWAEHGFIGPLHGLKIQGLNWQQANDYCSALKLGGFSGWRIPTLDEVKGIAYTHHVNGGMGTYSLADGTVLPTYQEPFDMQDLKIGEWSDPNSYGDFVWTSTPSPYADKSAWIVGPYVTLATVLKTEVNRTEGRFIFKSSDPLSALCVRPMEPDILAIAKGAQVDRPVPDPQTLKAYVPLNKARLEFNAGQFEQSIADAQSALTTEPRLSEAYYGMGVAQGMLGHWDPAIASLKSALKIDKNYADAQSALAWANAGKKAAKKGEKPKIKGKEWKNPEWKAPWS